MDPKNVGVEIISEYTARAIDELDKKGEPKTVESIRSLRKKLYSRDIEIASIVNGMKLK